MNPVSFVAWGPCRSLGSVSVLPASKAAFSDMLVVLPLMVGVSESAVTGGAVGFKSAMVLSGDWAVMVNV